LPGPMARRRGELRRPGVAPGAYFTDQAVPFQCSSSAPPVPLEGTQTPTAQACPCGRPRRSGCSRWRSGPRYRLKSERFRAPRPAGDHETACTSAPPRHRFPASADCVLPDRCHAPAGTPGALSTAPDNAAIALTPLPGTRPEPYDLGAIVSVVGTAHSRANSAIYCILPKAAASRLGTLRDGRAPA
jgi:hypothetical protein